MQIDNNNPVKGTITTDQAKEPSPSNRSDEKTEHVGKKILEASPISPIDLPSNVNNNNITHHQFVSMYDKSSKKVLLEILDSGDPRLWELTATSHAISQLGKENDFVLKTALEWLKSSDQNLQRKAVGILCWLGEVEVLLESLKNFNFKPKEMLANALGQLSEPNELVIKCLFALLKDDDSEVRSKAEEALIELSKKKSTGTLMVPFLLEALKNDQHLLVHEVVIVGYLNAAVEARDSIVDALFDALKNYSTKWLGYSLMRFENTLGKLIKVILKNATEPGKEKELYDFAVKIKKKIIYCLDNGNIYLQRALFRIFGLMGHWKILQEVLQEILQENKKNWTVKSWLERLTNEDEISIRLQDIEALGMLADTLFKDERLYTILTKALGNKDNFVRLKAAAVVYKLYREKALLNKLISTLNNKNKQEELRLQAMHELVQLGDTNESVIEAIVEFLLNYKGHQKKVVEVLRQFKSVQEFAAKPLLKALKDKHKAVQAVRLLGLLGEARETVVKALFGMFSKNLEEDVWVEVIYALAELGKIGTAHELIINSFLEVLNNEEYSSTQILAAIFVLEHLGARLGDFHIQVKTALLAKLESKDTLVKQGAAIALTNLLGLNSQFKEFSSLIKGSTLNPKVKIIASNKQEPPNKRNTSNSVGEMNIASNKVLPVKRSSWNSSRGIIELNKKKLSVLNEQSPSIAEKNIPFSRIDSNLRKFLKSAILNEEENLVRTTLLRQYQDVFKNENGEIIVKIFIFNNKDATKKIVEQLKKLSKTFKAIKGSPKSGGPFFDDELFAVSVDDYEYIDKKLTFALKNPLQTYYLELSRDLYNRLLGYPDENHPFL
jgi:HEAT repeat protein